jgi:PmbA protein
MDNELATTERVQDAQRLQDLAAQVLELAKARGASQAEVAINEDSGLAVNVRMGEVETVERTRDRGVALTVYFGQRKASASTADLQPESLVATVDQACAIAKYTEADPAAGLADAELMASGDREFDQWHPWRIDAEGALALALAAESRGREVDARIGNSDGAAVNTGESLQAYANSHGFRGFERSTSHSISCSLIAGKDDSMQRDYWYTTALNADDLESAASVGKRAAERALARLGPRTVATGEFPVLFAPEMARSLIAHLVGAVSGGALYRRASFLLDAAGTQVFPDWFQISEDPFLQRGFRSAAWDAEGVATRASDLVREGVLQRYVLGS